MGGDIKCSACYRCRHLAHDVVRAIETAWVDAGRTPEIAKWAIADEIMSHRAVKEFQKHKCRPCSEGNLASLCAKFKEILSRGGAVYVGLSELMEGKMTKQAMHPV